MPKKNFIGALVDGRGSYNNISTNIQVTRCHISRYLQIYKWKLAQLFTSLAKIERIYNNNNNNNNISNSNSNNNNNNIILDYQ